MRFPPMIAFLLAGPLAFSQADTIPGIRATSSVTELLKVASTKVQEESTSLATQVELSVRETPGIVSVLNEEDIKRSGARDLRELLATLPGINFEVDVQNVVGMGLRGLWGQEGKVLVLLDGHQLNETGYGTFSYEQHIFLENIKRVEVIRGPGSAIYGGLAGLCVINITSKNYSANNTDATISHTTGISRGKLSRQTTQFGFGKKWNSGVSLNITGAASEANLSNVILDSINYADSSAINSNLLALQFGYRKLHASVLLDRYETDYVEGPGRSTFNSAAFQLNYENQVTEKITLLPYWRLKIHQPWNFENIGGDDGDINNQKNDRNLTGLRLLFQPNEKLSLVNGIEHQYDQSKYIDESQRFTEGEKVLRFSNLGFYAQAIYKTKWATLTGGGRLDVHSVFGSAFTPRLGITRVLKKLHFKFLLSDSFKAPTLANLNANRAILPERLTTTEAEVGYLPNNNLTFTANVFFINVTDPILFSSPDGLIDNYRNGENISTSGIELAMNYRQPWGSIKANYSYYRAVDNSVEDFDVPGQSALLGFPQHKIYTQTNVVLTENVEFITALFLQTGKHYVSTTELFEKMPTHVQVNAVMNFKKLFYKGLSLHAGVYNITNSVNRLVKPYFDPNHPIPLMGREFLVTLTFNLERGHE